MDFFFSLYFRLLWKVLFNVTDKNSFPVDLTFNILENYM